MQLRATCLPLLFLLLAPWQSPQNVLRQHYEAAESQRRAGNYAAAETEYKAMLAVGYDRVLGDAAFDSEESHRFERGIVNSCG